MYVIIFTAPYFIIQPSSDDTVQIFPPNTTNFPVICALNVEIPIGMTITWLHNGNVTSTVTNRVDANTNTVQQTAIYQPGVYQCAFNYTTGYIVRRNITVLGMCSIIHS